MKKKKLISVSKKCKYCKKQFGKNEKVFEDMHLTCGREKTSKSLSHWEL